MRLIIIVLMFIVLPLNTAAAERRTDLATELRLSHDSVNAAEPPESAKLDALSPELTLKLQVLMDRAHFSPGEIDGHMGENTIKAFNAFQRVSGSSDRDQITAASWQKLSDLGRLSGDASQAKPLQEIAATQEKPQGNTPSKKEEVLLPSGAQPPPGVLVQVPLTKADLRGPFARRIPQSMKAQARLRGLSYRNPDEALGERYHSSPELLNALNPGVRFRRIGQRIWVPNIHTNPPESPLSRIVADKRFATATAYGEDGRVLAVYRATIGSEEKPTPDGKVEVARVARNPRYTYDPRLLHFKEVKTRTKIRIAPGPHNPVGLVWIELSHAGYGIHGAPRCFEGQQNIVPRMRQAHELGCFGTRGPRQAWNPGRINLRRRRGKK